MYIYLIWILKSIIIIFMYINKCERKNRCHTYFPWSVFRLNFSQCIIIIFTNIIIHITYTLSIFNWFSFFCFLAIFGPHLQFDNVFFTRNMLSFLQIKYSHNTQYFLHRSKRFFFWVYTILVIVEWLVFCRCGFEWQSVAWKVDFVWYFAYINKYGNQD